LTEAISDVLETMCFLEIEPLGEVFDGGPVSGDAVTTRISFLGDGAGHLQIQFPKRLASLLATQFMGKDPQNLSEEDVMDTVCECTNMAGGGYLQRIDPEAAIALSLPEIVDHEERDPSALRVGFDVEGHLVLAELCWKFSGK
jgi:CheY-specific phosphatase CheX